MRSAFMSIVRYTKEHEWIRLALVEVGAVATVGISAYAQQQLGDIVFVELPDVGREVTQGGEAAVVESVKAASEVYAPVDGEVVETNPALVEEPAKVNTDPEGNGWFFRLKIADPGQLDSLMDEAAYQNYLQDLA
jgi:glycine cleavage system H protein